MDDLDLLAGARIEWVSDRFAPQDVKPRHIGRVVSFSYVRSKVGEGIFITGSLDGVAGNRVIVSGDEYSYDCIENLKIWRRKVA